MTMPIDDASCAPSSMPVITATRRLLLLNVRRHAEPAHLGRPDLALRARNLGGAGRRDRVAGPLGGVDKELRLAAHFEVDLPVRRRVRGSGAVPCGG